MDDRSGLLIMKMMYGHVAMFRKSVCFVLTLFATMSGHCHCSFQLQKMVFSVIVGAFGKVLLNCWVISCSRYILLILFKVIFKEYLFPHYLKWPISIRQLELLEKHFLRVVVMMKVQVRRHRDVLSLRYLEERSVMRFLLHCIWFELM